MHCPLPRRPAPWAVRAGPAALSRLPRCAPTLARQHCACPCTVRDSQLVDRCRPLRALRVFLPRGTGFPGLRGAYRGPLGQVPSPLPPGSESVRPTRPRSVIAGLPVCARVVGKGSYDSLGAAACRVSRGQAWMCQRGMGTLLALTLVCSRAAAWCVARVGASAISDRCRCRLFRAWMLSPGMTATAPSRPRGTCCACAVSGF